MTSQREERSVPRTVGAYIKDLGIVAVLGLVWYSAVTVTGIEHDLSDLSHRVASNYEFTHSDYMERLDAMNRRVSALEASRANSDKEQAATTAAISGLQAQTTAMQGAINDTRDSIKSIQADIANMTRLANAPLPGGRR